MQIHGGKVFNSYKMVSGRQNVLLLFTDATYVNVQCQSSSEVNLVHSIALSLEYLPRNPTETEEPDSCLPLLGLSSVVY